MSFRALVPASRLAVSLLLVLPATPPAMAQQSSTLAASAAAYPELFYKAAYEGDLGYAGAATVLAELSFAGGRAQFVGLPGGRVGVVAGGALLLRALDRWMSDHDATVLEVFLAMGGRQAPAALWSDHRAQGRREARPLPGLEQLFAGNVAAPGGSGQGFKQDWFADSSACGADDLDLFWFWFQYHDWDVWGARGVPGHGEWTGQANITLGGTSRGVIAVCGGQAFGEADLDIVEYVPGLGWIHVMDIPNFGSFAYGFFFQGYQIRHIRMTVRNTDEPFFWAASY